MTLPSQGNAAMLAEFTERLANATAIEANASLDDIWVTLTVAGCVSAGEMVNHAEGT